MTTTNTQETAMNYAATTIKAHDLKAGDVILAAEAGRTAITIRNTVTSDAHWLGGTGKVAFGLTREGREPWTGRLDGNSDVLVERAGTYKVTAFRAGARFPEVRVVGQALDMALERAKTLADSGEYMLVVVAKPARIGSTVVAQYLEGRRTDANL